MDKRNRLPFYAAEWSITGSQRPSKKGQLVSLPTRLCPPSGNVEKSHQPTLELRQASQRRSRHFAVLTYSMYARASKWLRPYWTDPSERPRACFFEHSLLLMLAGSSRPCSGHGREIFNRPIIRKKPEGVSSPNVLPLGKGVRGIFQSFFL